jgi:hypothetical protein
LDEKYSTEESGKISVVNKRPYLKGPSSKLQKSKGTVDTNLEIRKDREFPREDQTHQ